MSDTIHKRQKANELRQKGNFGLAIPLYQELNENNPDRYSAAGLINCYRKTGRLNEAITLAIDAYDKYPDFNWCKNEYIWALIQGRLNNFSENGSLNDLIVIVNDILKADPDSIGRNYTIFKLLKSAKVRKNWDVLNEWITQIDINTLDDEKEGWNDSLRWYYYRVESLLYLEQEEKAISILVENSDKFAKKAFYFERLKAKAYTQLGSFERANESYKKAISLSSRIDWWLLHEYAKLLKLEEKKEETLSYMLKAAAIKPILNSKKVTLYNDIADQFIELHKKEEAYIHYLLVKRIRIDEKWGLSDIDEKINSLKISDRFEDLSCKDLSNLCQNIWNDYIDLTKSEDSLQNQLVGKVSQLYEDKTFCFIETKDKKSFFCLKRELPKNSQSGQIVTFFLKPSFDKKKNKKSFSATKVRIKN